MKRTLIIIFLGIIAIPFLLVVGYIGCGLVVKVYTIHILKHATPDAEWYDYQCYEYREGPVHSYEAHFYKFSAYHSEYTQGWETEYAENYDYRTRRIYALLFTNVIIINPTTRRATIEYHVRL